MDAADADGEAGKMPMPAGKPTAFPTSGGPGFLCVPAWMGGVTDAGAGVSGRRGSRMARRRRLVWARPMPPFSSGTTYERRTMARVDSGVQRTARPTIPDHRLPPARWGMRSGARRRASAASAGLGTRGKGLAVLSCPNVKTLQFSTRALPGPPARAGAPERGTGERAPP